MKGFQEHGKDIDREILLKLKDDKEFLKSCNLNNYFRNEVCNDNFFRTRLSITYPNTLKYKTKKQTWKQYFLEVIYYLAKLEENYQYKYEDGNFKIQLEIFKQSKDKNDLLIESSVYGELSLVKYLVEQGANIHADND